MGREELFLFGERVHNRRNAMGLTQEHVSSIIGISLRFYQMVERGEKSLSLDTLIKLGKTLNVSIDYLLFGTFPEGLENPLVTMFEQLSPVQRDHAAKILQLYVDACGSR